MARIGPLVTGAIGLVLCFQAAVGLAGELGAGAWRAAGRLSVAGRLPLLADYTVFVNLSLLVAGIAVLVAAGRLRGR
ncbi:hypothetical protein [Streptomonospora wellingtoniae]|uniref:Uncharacterized protein n=1 Tax=Streptomonospora wellingtoniae TaxID=3075544 RepID=A0ABU2KNE1_9ACTN|nr:hypothetical protein [Streptomonospora sp. DSM 45055]MDT0300777.1 hypothetical protein [Streptomonospora sp. DSM 45055]